MQNQTAYTKNTPNILIMAAGTGGHIFPALAVAKQLKAQGCNVYWLATPNGMEHQLLKNEDIPLLSINIQGLRGNGLMRLVKAPLQILAATLSTIKIIKSLNINVVAGFGGYVAGPGGLAAKLTGTPLLIQEQNAVAGFTNKVLSKLAKVVCQAFPNTFEGHVAANKIITTGNPIRSEILNILPPEQRYTQKQGNLVIQIIGGSLGAKALNEQLPQILASLNLPLTIKHQCGKGHLSSTQANYSQLPANQLNIEVTEFVSDMATAYAQADLVICRAGASTVCELAAAGVPAVFVPLPSAVDDHQTANAKFLSTNNAALLCPQNQLNSAYFKQFVQPILNRIDLQNMAQHSFNLGQRHATTKVADAVFKLSAK